MNRIIRGAATLFAVLWAVVPGTTLAENSPLGVDSQTSAEGRLTPSTGIAMAMLATPNLELSLDKAAPQGDPFLPVSLPTRKCSFSWPARPPPKARDNRGQSRRANPRSITPNPPQNTDHQTAVKTADPARPRLRRYES